MEKPIYKSRKAWMALVTGLAAAAAYYTGNEALAGMLTALGSVLVGAFGLEDHGKAKALK